MIKFPVHSRGDGQIKFEAEIDCDKLTPYNVKVGLAVKWALANGINLRDAYLSGACLVGVDLSDADLSDADLSGADLSGANLIDADFAGVDLQDITFRGQEKPAKIQQPGDLIIKEVQFLLADRENLRKENQQLKLKLEQIRLALE